VLVTNPLNGSNNAKINHPGYDNILALFGIDISYSISGIDFRSNLDYYYLYNVLQTFVTTMTYPFDKFSRILIIRLSYPIKAQANALLQIEKQCFLFVVVISNFAPYSCDNALAIILMLFKR